MKVWPELFTSTMHGPQKLNWISSVGLWILAHSQYWSDIYQYDIYQYQQNRYYQYSIGCRTWAMNGEWG